jgi:hypothetical protein
LPCQRWRERKNNRAGGIRTHGLYVPNVALYQAEPQPVMNGSTEVISRSERKQPLISYRQFRRRGGVARRARRFLRKYVLFLSEVMRHCSAPYSDAGVECWRLLPKKPPCPPFSLRVLRAIPPLHSHRELRLSRKYASRPSTTPWTYSSKIFCRRTPPKFRRPSYSPAWKRAKNS